MTTPVLLGPGSHPSLAVAQERASHAAGDVTASIAFAVSLAPSVPLPGEGSTRELWELLASIASVDLTVARVCEPHLDALAILGQAGVAMDAGRSWGVFAAEVPGTGVEATMADGTWTLSGTKAWCSLAGVLDSALITARTTDGDRRLFAIDLRSESVTATTGAWVARGLAGVTSEAITLDAAEGTPVGESEWYLTRPGFAWGGIGVAAIWFGGAVALGRSVFEAGRDDPIAALLLGSIDVELRACRAVLAEAAIEVDAGSEHPSLTAQRVRSTVATAAERVRTLVGHALGPAPLAMNEEYARRVADLELYVRQDHAERDLARIGTKLLERGTLPW